MKIILAEDQPLILSSLKVLLSEEDGIEVVATASNGAEALILISEYQPDIAVLDIYMPQMDGIETAKRVMVDFPHIPVILLTTFDNPDSIRKAIEIGVAGFLLKDIEPAVFINALKAVAGGLIVYHSGIQLYLNTNIATPESLSPANDYCLSKKDLTIINYIVQGMSNKEISSFENSSEGSIKNRVSSILSKMSLQARTQIAVSAIKEGLV